MKVLFLTHSFPRYEGDAPGSFLLRLAIALREKGVRVHVIAPAAPGVSERDEFGGVTVERFRYAPAQYENLAYTGNMAQDVATSWAARFALVGFVGAELARSFRARSSFDPDVIHAHWWFPSGLVAAWLSSLLRRPLVTTLHGTDLRLAKSIATSRPLFRYVMRKSARVTAVSTWLAAEVTTLDGRAMPEVAPMPVATEKFGPGQTREKNRLLFAGRLNSQKGLHHLLHGLAATKPLAHLDVVGEGSAGPELRALASTLGVADRVTWHGQVDQLSLVRHYQRATALVVPSTDEGLGLVAAEALLCETPVIAFRSGGLVDVVQHETTGILVNPGDTSQLAAAIDEVVDDAAHMQALARAGRISVLSAFSPESAAARYFDIYKGLPGMRAA
ncbi:MAG: glycosyltransferase family 4 protein [Gemmatimonadaceae bacterium]|nr:glycosyltransferase family 4 protein [Gemmatimonadaceae bacterium]